MSKVTMTQSNSDLQGMSASELIDGRNLDWVTNNSEYRDYFPTLGGRGRRAVRRENA